MRSSMQVAAAVAAALASSYALATPPSLSTAANAALKLYVAGSSAAKPAFLSAVQTNLCGGAANSLTIASSPNANFLAVSCTPASGTYGTLVLNGSTTVAVYYRFEGGSVVGALPVVSGKTINTLNLSDSTNISCPNATNCTATVNGTSANNGLDDSFTGAISKQLVQVGITDLEPSVFISDNYPVAYNAGVYGSATPTALSGLTANTLFQQVFGVFVNTGSAAFSSSFKATPSLSKAALTNLFQGNTVDWSHVTDMSGNAVASSTVAVTVTNREAGSGTRTGASIYFTGDECSSGANSITDPLGATGDYFSTGDVLTQANKVAGAITYASIDNVNATKYPNLQLININGITPSNVAAAEGHYDYWFEATDVPNNAKMSATQQQLQQYLEGAMQTAATAPHVVDILAIPSATNPPALPVSSTASTVGGVTIYTNPYTRSGVSCNTPLNLF